MDGTGSDPAQWWAFVSAVLNLCVLLPEIWLISKICCYLFVSVPSYKLRIESMLLKEEFAANMGYLEPSINSMIVAGEGKCKLGRFWVAVECWSNYADVLFFGSDIVLAVTVSADVHMTLCVESAVKHGSLQL